MRKALVISLLAVAVLAGSGAAALHRYDASHADLIAEGITLAGVDAGGMPVDEARALLRAEIAGRLEEPLTITYRDRRFVVDPALVDVRTNLDSLVRSAVSESREGNFLTRSFRDLTGRVTETELELEVAYSREAVARVVAGIRREIDRPAREATSSASFAGVRITPSRTGVSVRERKLRAAIVGGVTSPEGRREIAVPARTLEPKTTTDELTARYRHFVAISRDRRELRLFADRRLVKTYRVGIGAVGFSTPAGTYEIETKAANPAWYVPDSEWAGDLAGKVIPGNDPSNPIKARWLGFHDGAGIHGTADAASIGTAASHGCIRMLVRDVIDLYDRVPLHTPLYIS
ncbi:MAG TPA: L,D-transpeptidase/peptidoglycan binding protein [Gaiellaceae bacterium]|nr:L,D-transpeptidase/peptidoglycan binding protein [Gaiellaceae bacterium]